MTKGQPKYQVNIPLKPSGVIKLLLERLSTLTEKVKEVVMKKNRIGVIIKRIGRAAIVRGIGALSKKNR